MSRATIADSAEEGWARMPARVETAPSFMAPPADSVRSSQCCTMVEIERARVLHRPAHQLGVHHRLAVVGDGHAARFLELPHLGQLLAAEPPGDGADRVDPHHARRSRAVDDELGHRAAVVGRRGVRHRADGGEPARRRGARPGGDVLFVLLPRLAQVGVQIDEARHHPLPAHVDHPNAGADTAGDPGTNLRRRPRPSTERPPRRQNPAEDRGPGRRADRDPFAGSPC